MNSVKKVFSWKWSTGEGYKKSARICPEQEEQLEKKVHDTVFMESIPSIMNEEQFTRKSSKREEQNEKLSSRYMIVQKSSNPFIDSSNYVNDLDTEGNFLRPKDSNKQ